MYFVVFLIPMWCLGYSYFVKVVIDIFFRFLIDKQIKAISAKPEFSLVLGLGHGSLKLLLAHNQILTFTDRIFYLILTPNNTTSLDIATYEKVVTPFTFIFSLTKVSPLGWKWKA